MSFSLGLNQNSASIGAGGDNNLLPYYPSDSMGSARIIKRSQKDDESNSKIGQNSSYNDGGAVREEKKSEHNIYNQEEKKLYIEEIKNQKFNYTLKSEEDKVQYIKECDDYFVKLQNYHSWFKSSLISKEEVQVNLKQRPEVLSKWGPKRCRIYLKLASLYYIINDESMKNELITKATEDLNEMDDVEDKSEVSECRRWLCLQKIESHINNENQEVKLLERCWNVKQRHFEGRRDFLDFYTIFLAKHLLRKGEYKKAKSAHQDALILRRQRKEFSEQDDFDWDKIETEVKNQLEDKIK